MRCESGICRRARVKSGLRNPIIRSTGEERKETHLLQMLFSPVRRSFLPQSLILQNSSQKNPQSDSLKSKPKTPQEAKVVPRGRLPRLLCVGGSNCGGETLLILGWLSASSPRSRGDGDGSRYLLACSFYPVQKPQARVT